MNDRITFPRTEGECSRQAHADLPEGTYEREISKEGFFGPAAFFHHRHPPTGWVRFEGPLRPHAFDLNQLHPEQSSPWYAPLVVSNEHVQVRFWQTRSAMPQLARNADGDQLLFVHRGAAQLFCDYGHLRIETGDYVLVPRGSMWRIEPDGDFAALMIEATNSSFGLPDKGLLGRHAIFDPALLDTPKIDDAFRAQQSVTREWTVQIKRREALSYVAYPFNPLDAVGWHGDLAVARINVKHIRPVMSHRYHLPPSVHTTFVAHRFVVCTFVPRPFETDAGALKVPFFHNNDDYDEVIFYHAGDFFSRDNIKPGMMTLHPCGFTHGPHPKALKHMLQQSKPATNEYAVMIDARDALDVSDAARGVEWEAYVDSWK